MTQRISLPSVTLSFRHLVTTTQVRQQRRLSAGLHAITLLLLALSFYVRTLPPTPTAIPEAYSAEAAWWWPKASITNQESRIMRRLMFFCTADFGWAAALPAALWLAATLPRRFADPRYLSAGIIPLLMLQWFHLAAWLYQNTLPWDWPN